MKKLVVLGALMVAAATCLAQTQFTTDLLGSHDLGPGGRAPIKGALAPCQFCHAPHSARGTIKPLWAQQLSTATYTLYTSSTMTNVPQQPALGSSSSLCLSCHDGTVAPGQVVPWGNLKMSGSMNSQDVFGTNLQAVHPFNFKLPLQPSPNLLSMVLSGKTANPAVKLIAGNVECTTCHTPHVEAIDPVALKFLVTGNADSQMCLACHVSTPGQTTALAGTATGVRTLAATRTNTLATATSDVSQPAPSRPPVSLQSTLKSWSGSVHATASHKVAKGKKLGPYGNLKKNGCLSCHPPHGVPKAASSDTVGQQPLLNTTSASTQTLDAITESCVTCHSGGTNVTPALLNVFAELGKAGHPFPAGSNKHTKGEGAVLNNNRHATCVDCHDPHSSAQTTSFTQTSIRGSQAGAIGVSPTDATTPLIPAANQYETCLRCHGTSAGKQVLAVFGYLPTRLANDPDPLNIIPEFSAGAKSSHPVMHDRNSALTQPSLRKFMLNLDGRTEGRVISTRILCTDCHNSDDNREFGGTGPNGPHGSQYSHILERRYEFSQVAPGKAPTGGPGTAIQNLLPPIVDPAASGPFSLCAKCHDLTNIVSDASFKKHNVHLKAGFSCSVCHTAHGMGLASSVSGERLVNFDLQVVGQNDSTAAISYTHGTSTCVLKCHNVNHNADGSVTPAVNALAPITIKR